MDFINTGVPHVVVQVEDLDNHPVFEQGRDLSAIILVLHLKGQMQTL